MTCTNEVFILLVLENLFNKIITILFYIYLCKKRERWTQKVKHSWRFCVFFMNLKNFWNLTHFEKSNVFRYKKQLMEGMFEKYEGYIKTKSFSLGRCLRVIWLFLGKYFFITSSKSYNKGPVYSIAYRYFQVLKRLQSRSTIIHFYFIERTLLTHWYKKKIATYRFHLDIWQINWPQW